jgi:hypothetical protein
MERTMHLIIIIAMRTHMELIILVFSSSTVKYSFLLAISFSPTPSCGHQCSVLVRHQFLVVPSIFSLISTSSELLTSVASVCSPTPSFHTALVHSDW